MVRCQALFKYRVNIGIDVDDISFVFLLVFRECFEALF